MAQASISLSQDKLTEFQPISASALHVLARMAARRAIQEELRSQGVRVSLVKPAEISAKAQAYLAEHPELYRAAFERAQLMGMYEKHRRRAEFSRALAVLSFGVGSSVVKGFDSGCHLLCKFRFAQFLRKSVSVVGHRTPQSLSLEPRWQLGRTRSLNPVLWL